MLYTIVVVYNLSIDTIYTCLLFTVYNIILGIELFLQCRDKLAMKKTTAACVVNVTKFICMVQLIIINLYIYLLSVGQVREFRAGKLSSESMKLKVNRIKKLIHKHKRIHKRINKRVKSIGEYT